MNECGVSCRLASGSHRYDGIVPLEVKRDWYPHRVIYEDAREHSEMSVKAAAAAVSTSSRRSLETLCQGPVVARVRSWKAHTDAITSLEVVANANCILTAGYDRMAMTWALHKEGERMGALRQTPSDWHFPVRTDLSTIDAGKLKVRRPETRRRTHTHTHTERERERERCPCVCVRVCVCAGGG